MNQEDNKYEQKELNYFTMSKTRKKKILELAGIEQNREVLDIGCGIGELGEYFKNINCRITGLDVSANILNEAKKRLDEVFKTDIESNDWPPELMTKKFNLIIASELFEHLDSPENLLKKIRSLLKPDGHLIITTPNFLVWTNRIKMFFGRFAYTEGGFFCRDHIHFFTLPELKKMLEGEGFKIVEENHLRHPKVLEFLNKIFPALFSFQLIVKAAIKQANEKNN